MEMYFTISQEMKVYPILYPYNYNRCYRMPYVYRKYDSLVSFELLMNNYLSGNKKGELNEGSKYYEVSLGYY